jgi:hypothetical protein
MLVAEVDLLFYRSLNNVPPDILDRVGCACATVDAGETIPPRGFYSYFDCPGACSNRRNDAAWIEI